MIELIPAILPKNETDLEESLARIQGVGGLIQIDLVEKNVLQSREAMPLWEEFDFEFDLFFKDTAAEIESCIALGASRIIIHAQSKTAAEALQKVQHLRGGTYAVEIGLGLKVDDEPSALEPYAGLYDYVQVMGIAQEGMQGQPFDERCLELVSKLRSANPTLIIQVDGGVDALQIPRLKAAGVNRLVVGHAIFNAQDPLAAYAELAQEVNKS